MSSAYIYLDESGDLGWKFDRLYRDGGSSRFLTIAALVITEEHRHRPKRTMRELYSKHRWPKKEEKKWFAMDMSERISFANSALKLSRNTDEAKYFALTVRKENVKRHIRDDENKLYNYMINKMLMQEMAKYETVTFVPDPRSMKVASGNSLHDYLQINLWFELGVKTQLVTSPGESSNNLNVQFADMLSGAVQSHYEDRRSEPWQIINSHVNSKKLFF